MSTKKQLCHFCEKEATHFDIVLNQADFIVADVCLDHLSMGLVS
jgi:hypothetical protein